MLMCYEKQAQQHISISILADYHISTLFLPHAKSKSQDN